MSKRTVVATAVLAVLALTGCQKPGSDPKVAAIVDGQKITVAELDAELKGAEIPNAQDPQVRRAGLDRIVARKLMARAAEKEGLDKKPGVSALRAAAIEAWEASLTEGATVAAAGAPTAAEAQAFVAAHPEMFANRTIYLVDQLILPQRPDPAVAKALEPANTMDAVIQVLREHNVPFRRGAVQVDSLKMAPQLSKQVAGMGTEKLFVLPEGPGFSINRVQASRAEPVASPAALAIATQILKSQRRAKALSTRLDGLRTNAKITYGPAFAKAE